MDKKSVLTFGRDGVPEPHKQFDNQLMERPQFHQLIEFSQPSTHKVVADNNPTVLAKYQNNQKIPVAEVGLEDS